MTTKIYRDTELYHYGVDGQKWGIRKYQNEDGSYKPGAEGRYDPEPSGGNGRKKRTMTDSEREDEEIAARADRIQKKNKGMSRRDAESAAEDEMISEYKAQRKADKAAKEEKRQEKNSYKKVIAKSAGRQFVTNLASSAAYKLTDNMNVGGTIRADGSPYNSYKKVIAKSPGRQLVTNLASSAAYKLTDNMNVGGTIRADGSPYNGYKTLKDGMGLYNYRQRKKFAAEHSDISPQLENDYELYHHGILGMKWGIRRYQNEDGSLTEEGKKKIS